MDILLAFTLGAFLLLVIFLPIVLWYRNQANKVAKANKEAFADAQLWLEVLATSPDGRFIWVKSSGVELCSRRLAVLLDLAPGMDSKFVDISSCFEGEAAGVLIKAVEQLKITVHRLTFFSQPAAAFK